MACPTCHGLRWTCEDHPELPHPHDGCDGAGVPCPDCQAAGEKPQLPPDWISMTNLETAIRTPIDLANWPPDPPPPAPTREGLWTVTRADAVKVSARLFIRGEWGFEAQLLHDGVFQCGHRFDTRDQAVRWLDEERKIAQKGQPGG